MTVVVDTNVAVAANGRGTHADQQCRLACVRRLRDLVKQDVVAIDDTGLVLEEYGNHLHHSGMPDVGDLFFKHVFNNQHQDRHVRRVAVTRSEDDDRGFEELPRNTLDPSDRKFLAVAVTARAVILNATDSDWGEQAAPTGELGVEVSQLCPQYASRRARRKQ